jgi:predicted phosphodiesterase
MSKLILTADNHFQYNTPISRTDDFVRAQVNKMKFLQNLITKYGATIVNAGDTTHKAREDKVNELLSMLLEYLPNMTGILGNHDLLSHRMDNLHKSAMNILIKAGKYTCIPYNKPHLLNDDVCLYGFHWGDEIQHNDVDTSKTNIAVWHKLIIGPNDDLGKHITNPTYARNIFNEFPEYDLILTGDNHKSFTISKGGRHLVNPGSLLRLTTKQKDYKPRVFLYDTSDKSLTPIDVPIAEDVISLDHLSNEPTTDFTAYIESLDSERVTIDFEENLKSIILESNVTDEVIDMIETFVENK